MNPFDRLTQIFNEQLADPWQLQRSDNMFVLNVPDELVKDLESDTGRPLRDWLVIGGSRAFHRHYSPGGLLLRFRDFDRGRKDIEFWC